MQTNLIQITLAKPIFNKEMREAAINALLNERFVLGESVFQFEEEFARYCGVDYAISTNSGTDALQIALATLGVTRGQFVLTSPATFIATSNSVIHMGATPIFADINLNTYTIDPHQIKESINAKTRVILPIHLYGFPADMDPINKIADKHQLSVIEDACQAHGASYKGRRVGSLGDIACFSFYPAKNMTVAGDGGMLVTNNTKVAETAAQLRDCGRITKHLHSLIGYSARLNTVNAAVGRVQLKSLDKWNRQRTVIAHEYNRLLSDIKEVILPPKSDKDFSPVYHLYVLRTKQRDTLRSWLESNGVQSGVHYKLPVHLQPIYQKLYGFKEGRYLKSEELCKTCLSIPMHPHLSLKEITFVSEKIHAFFD